MVILGSQAVPVPGLDRLHHLITWILRSEQPTTPGGCQVAPPLPPTSRCSAVGRLAVCPHHFYTISSAKGAELTRLDIPDSPFTTLNNENFFAMNCEHPHLLSFPGGLPLRGRASARKLSFQVSGSDVGTR